jgi:PAS domain S-box-containing protein
MRNFFKNLKIKTKLFFIAALCLIGLTFFFLSAPLALNFILGSAIVSIGIVLLFCLLNQITAPLSKLTQAARKIADGDFSENIIMEAKDEFGSLAKNIESMRISLRSTFEGLNEEITERKQIENELLLARQQLEQQVRERTAQLQRANEELNSEIQEHKQDQERINRLNEDMGLRIMERTSELQFANKELHEVNAMNQALLQAVPFPMGIVDEQGVILSLSPRLEAFVGKEAIGEKCWLFYKDNKEQCLDCPLRKGVSLGQTEIIEASGAFGGKIFSISHTGILFQGKKAVLVIYQDVSERRRQEEELRNAYEKLKTMQAQLVQSAKMASLGQLAGGVAHEINNPLTGVLNNIQLIKMQLAEKKDFKFDDFRNTLDVIEESALRCASIVRSLLDFSHSAEEAFLPLSLNDIAGKIIALIGHEMKLHNIAIEKQFDDALPLVLGDSQLLQQAVFDIVSNAQWAIRRKSSHGGLITIKTGYEPQMAIVSLSVSDTGIGISKENMEKLFEPFFTTKPVGEGTGLGLAIVYGIVKKHGGDIEATSELGQGAIFKISLPVRQAGLPVSA